ncbi:MAG: 4-hydroxy-tetrahydrodipicolinate reductase [Phycisphaerae bacterium]|nr:4-hydroxy-tetrahydrodipicolinate reductase [Phycisphaerae bacterium]
MIQLAIIGAAGRMGRRITTLAMESGQFHVTAGLELISHDALGSDIGVLAGLGALGVELTDILDAPADVVIDFSLPEGTEHWVEVCKQREIPMVIGTTGLDDDQEAAIAAASATIPIVKAGNYSMGINLLVKLIAQAAAVLGEEYDIEVTETHHRFKADAPSGTAIMLARAACEALGRNYNEVATYGRGGKQPRGKGEIGVHALRVGDTIGEHSVHFGNLGETITFSHSAHTRDTFVRGALRAAQWVTQQSPGLYSMCDVLGL